jgi:hypothetical protein
MMELFFHSHTSSWRGAYRVSLTFTHFIFRDDDELGIIYLKLFRIVKELRPF